MCMSKIYLITYCALDEQFEGNFFWHSCILLSIYDSEHGRIRVEDNWGFYGLPTTQRSTLTGLIKVKMGLDVDFEGNHGMLRHEDLRFLETGFGLHGVTFEVSQENYQILSKRCKDMESAQHNAINEAVAALKLEQKPGKVRIYPYEHKSNEIYQWEIDQARVENRKPRLKAFTIKPTFSLFGGVALNQSRTCKTQSLKLLKGVLTPTQLSQLSENGVHPTVPRYSGKLEDICLYSEGPLRAYQHNKTKKITHYRCWGDAGTGLYWAIPPQNITYLTDRARQLFAIDPVLVVDVKKMISRLQKIEWLIRNAGLERVFSEKKQKLLDEIKYTYQVFSVLEKQQSFTLWSVVLAARNLDQTGLNLLNANRLLDRIYNGFLSRSKEMKAVNRLTQYDILGYMSYEDGLNLCKILERNYLPPVANGNTGIMRW